MKLTRTNMLKVAMAVFLLAIVLAFFIGTFSIKQPRTQAAQSVSARFFPRAIITLLAITSALCVYKEFTNGVEDSEEVNSRKIKSLILSVVIMGVSVLLLDILGFLIDGFLFLLLEIALMKEEKPNLTTILISLICTVSFSLIFRYGFQIGIPVLPFGL